MRVGTTTRELDTKPRSIEEVADARQAPGNFPMPRRPPPAVAGFAVAETQGVPQRI